MEITVNEAAPLVGKSPRAVRTWIAAGRLPARKTERGWLVRTAGLPLTEVQRQRLQQRATHVHDGVDAALPSRAATNRNHRARSLLDLDVFRVLGERIESLQQDSTRLSASHDLRRTAVLARAGALRLAAGLSERVPTLRMRQLLAARRNLATAVAVLHLCGDGKDHAAPFEQQILPMLGGLLRWSSRRSGSGTRR